MTSRGKASVFNTRVEEDILKHDRLKAAAELERDAILNRLEGGTPAPPAAEVKSVLSPLVRLVIPCCGRRPKFTF